MNNAGSFKKGHVPWNKGMKGLHVSPDTEFKLGQYVGPKHPSWKGGLQRPKNDCVHLNTGANKRVRRPVLVYMFYYNLESIPKGHVIWHADGDKDNDHVDNLEMISRAELLKRNKR